MFAIAQNWASLITIPSGASSGGMKMSLADVGLCGSDNWLLPRALACGFLRRVHEE
jgi:hypothetical protein